MARDHPGFHKYFQYFVKDMLRDQCQRVTDLSTIQVAYLSKGVSHLRKLLNPVNTELELALREKIKQHAVAHRESYDPYSISKVLRYLYSFNDSSESAL